MPWKILSVDDNKTIQFLVMVALKPFDCVVCEAANGEEGLEVAKREKPDLIILDINMPVMDGLTMLTHLRDDPELRPIPVIMLTSWSGQERVEQIADLGVLDYLVKPFTKNQLVEKVKGALDLEHKATIFIPPRSEGPPATPFEGEKVEAIKRFGLAPVPDSVACLASLVGEQEVNLGKIAEVISHDPTLTARLLRAANPHCQREEDYEIISVEHALALHGIGCALILTMSDLMKRAILKTFQTMLGITLESVFPSAVIVPGDLYYLSEAEFSGKALGRIRLRLTQRSTRAISSHLFGQPSDPAGSLPPIEEAVSELTNMVAGNFLSNLADAGLTSRQTPPKVGRTSEVRAQPTAGGLFERLAFKSPEVALILDINVDPWRV